MTRTSDYLEQQLRRQSLRRWRKTASRAATMPLSKLRIAQADARALQAEVSQVLFEADNRLALPSPRTNAILKGKNTDWVWRPALWRVGLGEPGLVSVSSNSMLGGEVTLFHDCKLSEISLRQVRNRRQSDLAPFGLNLDVYRFDGSFVSLALNAPKISVEGLSKRHMIAMHGLLESERSIKVYGRLNIRHGPNVATVLQEVHSKDSEFYVEFDLAYADLNEARLEQLWVDLIFEQPSMNQVVIRDVTFSRFLRADI